MVLSNSGKQENKFNKVLASIWKFNKQTSKFIFSKNTLIMFGITDDSLSENWYGVDDQLFIDGFSSKIDNFEEQ